MNDVVYSVPFYSQKWDLEQWEALGFGSEEDARYWERSSCAILCMQMAQEFFLGEKSSTHELIQQGVELGAYTDKEGWDHQGLCRLAAALGMYATSGNLSSDQLASEVGNGHLVMISIKWAFLNSKSLKERVLFWKKYGGHLALTVGVKQSDDGIEGFYVHHTSIREEYNWSSRFVPLSQFRNGYTGRAIVLSTPEE